MNRELLFPPRRQILRPGRLRPPVMAVRVSGPPAAVAPAAEALRSVGLELVFQPGADCSARVSTPSRTLIDHATAGWMKLYHGAGPERFAQAFFLECDETGLVLGAGGPAGLLYGLLHLAEAWNGGFCHGSVADWPAVVNRCVLLDVSRGRVPRSEFLRQFVDLIATLRFNQLTLNIEHVLMPGAGDPAEAEVITPEEIAALGAHCRARGIEYLPFQQSLGHLRGILSRPEYRHLAYDPERPWSLDPGKEESYDLLGQLYDRQMAVTDSVLFHAGCDEPFDLLRSFDPSRYGGRTREQVIVGHVARVARMIKERGRRPMVWADALPESPDLIASLPDDLVLCHWHYGTGNLEGLDHYRQKLTHPGRPFYACASTWSFLKPFPDLAVMRASNDGLFTAARERQPMGMMTTIWGDMGHANLPGLEIYPLSYAARHGWTETPAVASEGTREPILPLARLLHGIDLPALDSLPLLLDGLNRAFRGPAGMGGIGTMIFFSEPLSLPLLPADFHLDRLLSLLAEPAVRAGEILDGLEGREIRNRSLLSDHRVPMMIARYLVIKAGMIHSLRSLPRSPANFRLAAGECERSARTLEQGLELLERRWLANHKRSGFEANVNRWRRLIQAWRDRAREFEGYASELASGRAVPETGKIISNPPAGYGFDLMAEIGLKELLGPG